MQEVIWTTIELATVTTVLLLLLATPLAWWLAHRRAWWKEVIAAIASLPIVLPPTVLGFYLLIALAPDDRLRGIVFWLTGDLNGAATPWAALAALVLALAVCVPVAPQLNVLLRGDALASSLGVPAARLRLRIYVVASIAAAASVTTAGTIGFVGLVVPHALRLVLGNDQRMLVPASALAGGVAVMGADLVARTAIAPAQLPVGVVTALVGVPVFLWMLLGRRR